MLYLVRDVLIPFALAIILTMVMSPAVRWLQRMKVRRFPASVLVVGVSLVASAVVGYVIFNQLIQVVNDLPSYRENVTKKIQALRTPNKSSLGRAAANVRELGKELAASQPPLAPTGSARAAWTPSAGSPLLVQIVEAPANDLNISSRCYVFCNGPQFFPA